MRLHHAGSVSLLRECGVTPPAESIPFGAPLRRLTRYSERKGFFSGIAEHGAHFWLVTSTHTDRPIGMNGMELKAGKRVRMQVRSRFLEL